MNTPPDLFGEYISKAAQARTAKWSAIGNVFGFIIGAASIMAALAKPVAWMLMLILLFGFAGILALLRCFTLMHKGYVEIIDGFARDRDKTDDEKIEALNQWRKTPDPLPKVEQYALLCLYCCGSRYSGRNLS